MRLKKTRNALLLSGFLLAAGSVKAAPPLPLPEAPPQWQNRPVRLPPLFWYELDQKINRRLFMAGLLYWDARDTTGGQNLLVPFYYRWWEGDRAFWLSLPLVMGYQRPGERWTVAGPFYRQVDSEAARTGVFPLYWQKIRHRGGRVTVALPFLFYDYRSAHSDRIDQISLVGWRRVRPGKNSGALLAWWWSQNDEASFKSFFPVYWHLSSPQEKLSAFGPLYFRSQNPAFTMTGAHAAGGALPSVRRWAGLFPLAGAGWGNGVKSNYLFPLYYWARGDNGWAFITLPASRIRQDDRRAGHAALYYYSHDSDQRTDGFFPLWMRRSSADGYEGKRQLLNFYSRRENDEYFQTLFPLYGYWSNDQGAKLLSWGVWWKRSLDGQTGWAWLYYWKKTAEKDSTRVLFPLYWHFWREPDWGMDVFFPFYTRYRDGDTTITAVPPLIWRKSPERTTWSAFFLYWKDKDVGRGSTTFLPLFHSHYDPQRRMFFSPWAWTRRSRSSREGIVPPVYYYKSAEAQRFFVVPLYWRVRAPEQDFTVVPPYYHWRNNHFTARGIFPLFGRHRGIEEHGSYLFPFYWYAADKTEATWVLPPLLTYINKRTGEDERLNVQYLLFGNVTRSKDGLSHDFFPLYKYIRQGDYANFWAPRGLALTAWERKGSDRKGFAFPYAWRRSPERNWDFVFPLWYHSSDYELLGDTATARARGMRQGGAAVVFPLWWSGRNPERSYAYFVPLFAHYKEGPRRFSAFTPLWISHNSAAGGKFRMLFPLYWRFLFSTPSTGEKALPPLQKDISVLGPFYRVQARGPDVESRTVGLAPFFSSTVAGREDRYFEILGGLFARDVQGGRRRFRFFYLFYTPARPLK